MPTAKAVGADAFIRFPRRSRLASPPHGIIQLLKIGAGAGVILHIVIEGTGLAVGKPLIVVGDDLRQVLVQFLHRQHTGPRLAVFVPERTFYFVQIADDCQHRRHVLIKALFRVSHFTGSLGDGEIQRQAVRHGGGVQLQRIAAAGVEP